MSTRVVNIRDLPSDPAHWPADHVYIGRRRIGAGRHLEQSLWANPYRIGRDGDRAQVVAGYERLIRGSPAMMALIPRELRGKTLVCWCAPEACHGDVLARLADEAGQ